MKSDIVFADAKIKKAFEKLRAATTEDKKLYNFLIRAFEDLEEDAFCGTQIQKRLIPKEYITKYGKLDNLWNYDLPDGWRLIYTIKRAEIIILTIILEWLDHKNYERRFKY
jgi:hypothetical protein